MTSTELDIRNACRLFLSRAPAEPVTQTLARLADSPHAEDAVDVYGRAAPYHAWKPRCANAWASPRACSSSRA